MPRLDKFEWFLSRAWTDFHQVCPDCGQIISEFVQALGRQCLIEIKRLAKVNFCSNFSFICRIWGLNTCNLAIRFVEIKTFGMKCEFTTINSQRYWCEWMVVNCKCSKNQSVNCEIESLLKLWQLRKFDFKIDTLLYEWYEAMETGFYSGDFAVTGKESLKGIDLLMDFVILNYWIVVEFLECKLMIVGYADAGKTSLCHALKHFYQNHL